MMCYYLNVQFQGQRVKRCLDLLESRKCYFKGYFPSKLCFRLWLMTSGLRSKTVTYLAEVLSLESSPRIDYTTLRKMRAHRFIYSTSFRYTQRCSWDFRLSCIWHRGHRLVGRPLVFWLFLKWWREGPLFVRCSSFICIVWQANFRNKQLIPCNVCFFRSSYQVKLSLCRGSGGISPPILNLGSVWTDDGDDNNNSNSYFSPSYMKWKSHLCAPCYV